MTQYYKLDNVNELAGGDESFISVLVQTFLEEIPNDIVKFSIDVLKYIKILESWSADAIGQEEATFAMNTILDKANAAIEEMKKDFL